MGYTKGLITGLTFGFFLGAMAGTLVMADPCDKEYSSSWQDKYNHQQSQQKEEQILHYGTRGDGSYGPCIHALC